ncbi:MAG: NAD-dependent deacylase [Anaerolineales bacterium]|jgi:NAD-dependent deacetylase|nr:NAD-dependent deacylase [Anaerolineales bacterium]
MTTLFAPELISFLRAATRVAVLTGAGVSQESGLRTFRDAQVGIWAQYRPEDLATPEAFQQNPRLVWDFYATRREGAGQVEPNPGHYALAELEKRFAQFTLITQNIDSLHARAGSRNLIELHGNLRRIRCSRGCGVVDAWDELPEVVPACPKCGSPLRPDVVWFGENLPEDGLQAAIQAANTCQAFFSIGTSGLVQPAASLAFWAKKRGAVLVEVNYEATPLTEYADYTFHGKSGEILPDLVRVLGNEK